MKPWHIFDTTTWPGLLLVASFSLACGSVDPADQPGGGSGGGGTGNAGAGAGGDDGGGGEGEVDTRPLLPWAVGNKWTYDIVKDGVESLKTTTIEAREEVGGTGPYASEMAFHVVTAKGAELADRTESWQAPDPENAQRIVRYREQSFGAMTGNLQLEEHWDPGKLHIDGSLERTQKDANWLESYSETKLEVGLSPTTHDVRERWLVLADDETLTVPAGTFENVIHLRKVGGSSTKEYWYVRGVGKLKETGSQTEELTDYSVSEGEP